MPLGESLYFRVNKSGDTSFEVRYTIFGKRRFIALENPFPQLSIAEARSKAAAIKLQTRNGKDPLEQPKLEESKPFNQF
ncbi:Arm DNA-binding domain-containing protein [Glaciecola sp. 33A]|jgi:hypothetical protein|uniref:Arm DNA-binding domain-containing protein n=1 Tax=Glaciecola sp. 33A TaxID=2057807 RepID=UPI0018E3A0A4|nr:Arm DNA-binding domain-containing protein [Glaciecola sp. 33A]